jgi:hypothetical protein
MSTIIILGLLALLTVLERRRPPAPKLPEPQDSPGDTAIRLEMLHDTELPPSQNTDPSQRINIRSPFGPKS